MPLGDEVDRVAAGELPPKRNRLALFGESGTGKSMFLVYCEQQIAIADDQVVPIRLGGGPLPAGDDRRPEVRKRLPLLSDFNWTAKPEDVLHDLADSLTHPLLPGDTTHLERRDWLLRLVRQGRVVFLLDALDQTRKTLDGLSKFLQSDAVSACPVLMSGRPETQQTRASVFSQADWDLVWVDPFDEDRIRRFLGDRAGALVPTRHQNALHQTDEDRRKVQLSELLKTPILLHELRELVKAEKLKGLKNRENVYAEALKRLIVKGLASARDSESQHTGWTQQSVARRLREAAWQTIHAEAAVADTATEDFTGVIAGDAFEKFKEDNEGILSALAQIDVATLESLFDEQGFTSLAWRHFSFCEYFAGVHLAEMSRAEREACLTRNARDPRWRWIFRFALCWAERERQQEILFQLAYDLIRYGNPFVVYDALDEDRLVLPVAASHVAASLRGVGRPIQPVELDRLCRWLVHCDRSSATDYRAAWKVEWPWPSVDRGTLDVLKSLFQRAYRNSRCLYPAWELLSSSTDSRAVAIRQDFLGEFDRLRGDEGDAQSRQAAQELVSEFVRCPRDKRNDRDPFLMGSREGERGAHQHERPQHSVIVTPFELRTTPVTNAQFEFFDASHAFLRNQYSPDDHCPVIYVNWYMASMFCLWLGRGCRLPTEAEWEYACRAGTTARYYTGDTEADLAEAGWYAANGGRTQPVGGKAANAWGLYDMHGNVWEWCQDWFSATYYEQSPKVDPRGPEEGALRVSRGGSWDYVGRHCRSAFRDWVWPERRNCILGFRVARSLSGK